MNLTIRLRLLPDDRQKAVLLATMQRFNEAASFAAKVGFEAGVFSQPAIHKRCYKEIRERFGLSAQLAVRAIGKAVEVFRRDKSACPEFRPCGAVIYDERILSFKGLDRVSVTTLDGRELIPIVFGEYQGERLGRIKGQVDLVYRDGQFHLYATVKMPEGAPIEAEDFLGVDLGIGNIAVDSDGNIHKGDGVEKVRRRYHSNRRRFQKRSTRSAKRRLQKMRRREARFRKDVNHRISKELVRNAKGTDRGIAMEDLSGIRDRTTVRREDRAKFSGWAYAQLRGFVEYKARLRGVPVVFVDPRDTSRTCSVCGHCERANRRSQAEFVCRHCGFALHADHNAALNVRHRGLLSIPHLAAGVDPRLEPRGNLAASPALLGWGN
jgi:IS605 OrfB family transposase